MTMRVENEKAVLIIEQDSSIESPREWDNLGTMVCFHNRYDLGESHNFDNPDEFKAEINDDNSIILPLYLYDHSGITMNTTGFSCPWDSGQVGWIYVTKEDVRKNWNVKRISKKLYDKTIQCLQAEVKVYDQYLTGDVYGFTIEDKEGNHIDSCWGFYGDNPKENGMIEHIEEQYHVLVEML